jgi:hypothetical protein
MFKEYLNQLYGVTGTGTDYTDTGSTMAVGFPGSWVDLGKRYKPGETPSKMRRPGCFVGEW